MILLCEVISRDLVLQYSRWFRLWGHISVDLRQELIWAYACVCVCVCRKRKLWFVVRPMACSQRQECGHYVCLCLFSYQSFKLSLFLSTPTPTPLNTHTQTHTPQSFWRKWGGRSRVFMEQQQRLQENAAKYCHPLSHCGAHSRETKTLPKSTLKRLFVTGFQNNPYDQYRNDLSELFSDLPYLRLRSVKVRERS